MMAATMRLKLFCAITVYLISSLGGVAIVKLLNYHFCFSSWLILALVSQSTWLLALALHLWLRGCCILGSFQRQYLIISLGLSIVELLNSMSMSYLPGSLYMLLKGSDVGWSMLLSRLVLDKVYNPQQVVAACLIMGGIALVLSKGSTDKIRMVPAGLCLIGALLNAFLSVWTEATLKQRLREQSDQSKLSVSNEYSMWTSFLSFVMISVSTSILANRGEMPNNNKDNTTTASCFVPSAYWVLVVSCLVFLGFSRFSGRLSKHWICVCDSAMTFSLAQAGRRLTGVFLIGMAFGEPFSNNMILGAVCSGFGFVLHYWYTPRPPQTIHPEYELIKKCSSLVDDTTGTSVG